MSSSVNVNSASVTSDRLSLAMNDMPRYERHQSPSFVIILIEQKVQIVGVKLVQKVLTTDFSLVFLFCLR